MVLSAGGVAWNSDHGDGEKREVGFYIFTDLFKQKFFLIDIKLKG